jgi:hemerythrin-like metal-binding protein
MKRPITPDPYTWKKEYELHNELYDEQAKKFLEIINRLRSIISGGPDNPDISDIFFQLTYYYEQYMIREEINMNKLAYAGEEAHRQSHRDFMDHIRAFREGYEQGDSDIYEDMYFYLERWFDDHMMADDRAAVEFISRLSEGELHKS